MILGGREFFHGVFLSPMAGFTDYAMRKVCHDLGAEGTVTEMVSAKAICYGDKKTLTLGKIREDEGIVSVQIFGSEPDLMAKASEIIEKTNLGGVRPFAIDVNMGCPVPKVYGNGEGSALMKNPDLIYEIIKKMTEATTIPVSVKLRLGVDNEHINAKECAKAAEAGGASWIALHGRTRSQMYAGLANREAIADVKKELRIPLLANGDITSGESALSMLKTTGADGITVGRGAVGNPFIFREILSFMDGTIPPEITLKERISVAKKQLSLAVFDKGETVAVKECRKSLGKYFQGFRGSASLRLAINQATTEREVLACLASLDS